MLNVSKAKDPIANIMLFFQVALHLFAESQTEGKVDNEKTREALKPMLELIYRIYTDEQYKDTRAKELSLELVEMLSTNIDKGFFIDTYNDVKNEIHRKRIERKKI